MEILSSFLKEVQAQGAMSEALKYLKKSNKFDKDEKVKSLQTRIAEMEHFGQVLTYTLASFTILWSDKPFCNSQIVWLDVTWRVTDLVMWKLLMTCG